MNGDHDQPEWLITINGIRSGDDPALQHQSADRVTYRGGTPNGVSALSIGTVRVNAGASSGHDA